MPLVRFPRWLRFRYSLRIAAIVLTAACVWLGLVASRAQRQQAAVATLARLGASVSYDRQVEDVWAPQWLRKFVGDDFFLNVVYVQLSHRTENRRMHRLTPAEFDEAVAAMECLPRLTYIYFGHTGVTDDDLARFAPLAGQIEELYFNEAWQPNLTGVGLKHLATWPRLASLGMPYGSNDPHALELLPEFPALTQLRWGNQHLDDDAFAAIARCQRLEQASLFMCRFSGADFSRLQGAPALQSVHLHNTRPEHYARHWPDDQSVLPINNDPRNEFEFFPDSGQQPWDPAAPKFPDQRYRKWLEEVLPGITVTEMYSS